MLGVTLDVAHTRQTFYPLSYTLCPLCLRMTFRAVSSATAAAEQPLCVMGAYVWAEISAHFSQNTNTKSGDGGMGFMSLLSVRDHVRDALDCPSVAQNPVAMRTRAPSYEEAHVLPWLLESLASAICRSEPTASKIPVQPPAGCHGF